MLYMNAHKTKHARQNTNPPAYHIYTIGPQHMFTVTLLTRLYTIYTLRFPYLFLNIFVLWILTITPLTKTQSHNWAPLHGNHICPGHVPVPGPICMRVVPTVMCTIQALPTPPMCRIRGLIRRGAA